MTIKHYTEIIETLKNIIKNTMWENHVFCVGGCVRDKLMGNKIKDIDLVIDLPCGGINFANWIYNCSLTTGNIITYPTYGTAMFKLKMFPEDELECVQTRKEKYTDINSRNPKTVFGTISDDCLRRDLTINSLYINISTGELLDITGNGINDINNHIIHTTTDPDIIYDDDPLRILRCIRFATRYGWKINDETYNGICKNINRLSIITVERINTEFSKMLTCKYPVEALNLLKDTGAMHYIIPELEQTYDMAQNKYHFGTVWEHTLKVVENLKDNSLELRLAALLHDIGKINTRSEKNGMIHFIMHEVESEKLIDIILKRLKYPNELISSIKFLAKYHMYAKNWKDDCSGMKDKSLRKLQYICKTEDTFNKLMLIIDADNNAHKEEFCLKNQVNTILQHTSYMTTFNLDMFEYKLPFTGNDIMQIKNVKPGPSVKLYMDYLLKLAFVNPKRSMDNWTKCLKSYKLPK